MKKRAKFKVGQRVVWVDCRYSTISFVVKSVQYIPEDAYFVKLAAHWIYFLKYVQPETGKWQTCIAAENQLEAL